MDTTEAIVTALRSDQGSVVIFEATMQNEVGDVEITFAVDHGYAHALVDALARDEEPLVALESWQILGVR
jgi:hypothetical protein